MVTRRVAFLMNGAYNFIISMFQMAFGYHFSHFNTHITATSPSTPSPASTVEDRRQFITIVYGDLL